ncbi:hypothetical protein ACFPTO_02315 [Paraburkholderia denitrificans]|uniref:Uncharacterized protein n=1 Tax=Paraburkholderia denitrificans TaxID=694025 RepID=A0ABW0J3N1_9BURK
MDHQGPWCQRDGEASPGEPGGRAERAKSRSVNMARIVAQRKTLKCHDKSGKSQINRRKLTDIAEAA